MFLLSQITDAPNQSMRLVIDNGAFINLTLRYVENQQGWFYSVEYPDVFSVDNRRLVVSPNLLRQFRDIIPFGFACTTQDGYEPILQDDFLEKRASFYLLTQADVAYVEASILHG